MTKHEKNITEASTVDIDLEQRVEKAILAFMTANDDAMPTIAELNRTIGTSNSRLCPAAKAVKARLMAVQTKLAAMPDIPEELTRAHEQGLKEMWAKAREFQTAEIIDLKRSQSAKDAMYRNDVAEMQEVIELVERAEQDAITRAEAAEKSLVDTRKALGETQAALITAEARLAEQDKILELFAAKMPSSVPDDAPKTSSPRTKKSGQSAAKPDEPETLDLLGFNAPANADADRPS